MRRHQFKETKQWLKEEDGGGGGRADAPSGTAAGVKGPPKALFAPLGGMDSVVKELWRPEKPAHSRQKTFQARKRPLARGKSLLLGPKDFLEEVFSFFRLQKACGRMLKQASSGPQVFFDPKEVKAGGKSLLLDLKDFFRLQKVS